MTRQLSLPLLLIALLITWTLSGPGDRLLQPQAPPSEPLPPAPDNVARGIVAREYAADGTLRSVTAADELRRWAGRAVVELDNPRRREFDGEDEWSASARHGILYERLDKLHFTGAAELRYLNGDAVMVTEELIIDLDEQTARSPVPVSLTQADGHRLNADKLLANLRREVAIFSENVTSVYVPSRQ